MHNLAKMRNAHISRNQLGDLLCGGGDEQICVLEHLGLVDLLNFTVACKHTEGTAAICGIVTCRLDAMHEAYLNNYDDFIDLLRQLRLTQFWPKHLLTKMLSLSAEDVGRKYLRAFLLEIKFYKILKPVIGFPIRFEHDLDNVVFNAQCVCRACLEQAGPLNEQYLLDSLLKVQLPNVVSAV